VARAWKQGARTAPPEISVQALNPKSKALESWGAIEPLPADAAAPLFRATEWLTHRKEKLPGGGPFRAACTRTRFCSLQTPRVFCILGEAPPRRSSTARTHRGVLARGLVVEPLVEALHRDPASAEWSKIYEQLRRRLVLAREEFLVGWVSSAGRFVGLWKTQPTANSAKYGSTWSCCSSPGREMVGSPSSRR
jgi:hypothetical protein